MVGEHTSDDAEVFLTDLASRLEGRVQLSTDGHRIYEGTRRKVEEPGPRGISDFMHYNFARPHQNLKQRYPRTPAMAAGVADHVWSLEEIAALLD